MSEVLEDNSVKESLINITTDLASDDFSRYLIDRMHQL